MTSVRGASLIEVLIASLLIMLGVTGFVSLQSEIVAADDQLNKRNIALQLAQEKLEDLAAFKAFESSLGRHAFNGIQTNQGGSLAAGQVEVVLNNNPSNIQAYMRTWVVIDLYYVDTDEDKASDTWVSSEDPWLAKPLPKIGQKEVSVSIQWLDRQGEQQQIVLSRRIAPIPQSSSAFAVNDFSSPILSPEVDFLPETPE